MRIKSTLRHIGPLLGLVLLFGAVYVVRREFKSLRLHDISAALAMIPNRSLILAAGCTIVSYAVLTFYDRLASIYAGHKVSYLRTSFASFCAYALAHNLGFAAVSGAAVRYRLYAHWGLSPAQIAKVVAFCSLTFGLGAMVLGGAILIAEPDAIPLFGANVPHAALYAVGAGLWAVVGVYVGLSKVVGKVRIRGVEAQLPSWRMAVLQVTLASVDVAVTAGIFDLLLPHVPGLTYPRFLAVYLASYSAGLAANLPGGIGVFDTAMLLGLTRYLPAPVVLSALLIFRLYYYIIPLFLAGGMFAGNEAIMRRHLINRCDPLAERFGALDFVTSLLAGSVALCGVLVLALDVVNPQPEFMLLFPDFAPGMLRTIVEAGDYIPSILGTALVVLAVGLSQRVTSAWNATIVALPITALFVVLQGRADWVPAVLIMATFLIAPFKTAFYRHTGLLDGQPQVLGSLLALAGCVIALTAFEPHIRAFDNNSWWDLVLSPELPNGLRASVMLAMALAVGAAWRLLRPIRVPTMPWDEAAEARYRNAGRTPPRIADGLILGDDGQGALAFRRLGPTLIGLGDPIGTLEQQAGILWRFRNLARQYDLDTAIWQAGVQLLPLCNDLGMTAVPLEPETHAPGLRRYLCCIAERDLSVLLALIPSLANEQATPIAAVPPATAKAEAAFLETHVGPTL